VGLRNLPVPGSKEIKVSSSYLREIAKEFQKDLDKLEEKRWSTVLEDTLPSEEAFGDYDGGHSFRNGTVRSARMHIGSTIDEFVMAYRNVIQALLRSAENYERAEENSKQGIEAAGRSGNNSGGGPNKMI